MGNKILYFHVPKCGGTSIGSALTALHGLMAVNLDAWASRRAAEAFAEDLLELREKLVYYHVSCASAPSIAGHFPWSPALASIAGDYRLVTMLRDPRAHFLSYFFWNRDKPKREHFPIDRNTTLRDFVHSERAVFAGSMFVRYFTDPTLRTVSTHPEAIEAACRNLMTLDAVGTLCRVDELVAEINQFIGCHLNVGHERTSPTSKANREAEIDDDLLAIIDELCRPNRAVYDAACRRQANRD
jgi:hypothetical protein